MEGQPQPGSENVPQEGTPSGYTPPPGDYVPPYQRPTTDQLIKSSYPGAKLGSNRFQRTDKIVSMITMGVFLMFLGAIIIAAVTTTGGPNLWDSAYDDDDNGSPDPDKWDNYYEDKRSYDTMHDVGVIVGKIVVDFGMLIAVLALFGGGIVNTNLDKFVRIGMIVAAGLIVAWSGLMVGWSVAL